jgi:ribosomal protein S18 acetylase RimI-like enzyme/nitroimidazol reductase NimA-like FMN-containing flavoprotein (pyridoxamine 5'-phosphate oxidase superfamily)
MDAGEARTLLARAPVVHVATTTASGEPMLRTVHGVVVGGHVAFHGAPAGEKVEAVGRPVVIAAEETVAQIPSYFVDPERACPATTYYRSVQVHGVLEEVTAPDAKALVLRALMKKFQPEGGHVPIDEAHPLYRKAIAGLMILRVPLDRMDGKAKLGQNRTPAELARVVIRLWERGLSGDARAVELVRDANPSLPTPAFLLGPDGARLVCAMVERDVAGAVELLAGEYWHEDSTPEAIAGAHRASSAWVGARDQAGRVIATARATSDETLHAFVYDVSVAPGWRGRGLGKAIVRLLLDHPAVRNARGVRLGTRDADGLYRRFGFRDMKELPPPAWRTIEMALRRVPQAAPNQARAATETRAESTSGTAGLDLGKAMRMASDATARPAPNHE